MPSTRSACTAFSIMRPTSKPRSPSRRWPEGANRRRPMNLPRLCAVLFGLAALVSFAPARAGEAHWPDTLVIATATPGGTYYVYGEGLAKILTRALDLPVTIVPTEGPAENIARLEAGSAQLGFVTM